MKKFLEYVKPVQENFHGTSTLFHLVSFLLNFLFLGP